MTTYKVVRGARLKGKVQLHGAKNAGFKAVIASLLADTPSEISNLSLISEIDYAKLIVTALGGGVETRNDKRSLFISPSGLKEFEIPFEIGSKSRSSTMYVAPLLKKFGKAIMPVPGGDIAIGKRPIDRHLAGLEAMGAQIEHKDGRYFISAPNGLKGTRYRFAKNTHTGTETLLMCAAFATGQTILENSAEEPEVDDLIAFLNAMGAKIQRKGRTIKISGVSRLQGANHHVMCDRLEAATFGCFALATKGEIEVLGADAKVLTAFLEKVDETGGVWEKTDNGLLFSWRNPLKPTIVTTKPYPGFMTDWQPTWTALMTQADGVSIVHETVMDSRFAYIPDLEKMGAEFELFNPEVQNPDEFYNFNLSEHKNGNFHAVKISGRQKLSSAEIEIDDIRRGATIILAGMVAKGETIVKDPKDQIARGYENLVGKLSSLGAKITVESQK